MHNAAYTVIYAVFTVLGLIPRPVAHCLGNALGKIWFLTDRKHREIALANLTRAFGGEKSSREIRMLARSTFRQLGQILFEIGWLMRLDPKRDRRYFRVTGLPLLKGDPGHRTGVLFLTAHMGNWEILSIIAAMNDIAVNVVYRPLDYPPMERFLKETRTRFGARMIPKARSMRKILKALDRKEGVVMLMDQNFDCHEGVFADFFGHPACTNKGLALIARKTGAPVVPAFMAREAGGFLMEIGPVIPFVRTGDKTKDLEINTLRYNRAIEDFIRRHPDQWFWVHQRWKTRPFHPWPRPMDKKGKHH